MQRNILCVDLKSFFATCECIERGIDPFKVPLVVANPNQGNGAITLAITPFLKAQGIKSRSRLYEIPSNVKYQIVPPRMSLYVQKSEEVINVYLDFVAKEDLHVYSIDEVFMDVTNYLKMYKKTDYELAEDILKAIHKKTGLYATCGIGPNLFLAKVALDTDAKNYKDGIAKWTNETIPLKLWTINPLSKMWGIGSRMEKNLNRLGIYTVGELAHYDKNKLKNIYGVIGEELWLHANGIDESIISDKNSERRNTSYSHSQVLFRDYNTENIKIIISEMIDTLAARLRKDNKVAGNIAFGIGYSKDITGGFYHNFKMEVYTDDAEIILKNTLIIFDRYIEDLPIRKVSISLGRLSQKDSLQLNLFEDYQNTLKKDKVNDAIDDVKRKYGKNSLLKASALLEDSTIIERNGKIGGHGA